MHEIKRVILVKWSPKLSWDFQYTFSFSMTGSITFNEYSNSIIAKLFLFYKAETLSSKTPTVCYNLEQFLARIKTGQP